jgi:hypothetical protein
LLYSNMKSLVSRLIEGSSMVLLLLALGLPCTAKAQWHADSIQNTPVCTATGQQDMPKGCTDGADGAIITWEDARSSTYQVYAQHLDATGKATWTLNGVKLSTPSNGTFIQTLPIITTDDSGGAYIVWLDGRYPTYGSCLYAQHIRANGSLAYPDSALPVGIALNNGCTNPTLCNDGRGGAYVAWEDNRALNPGTRPDIWMNRLWPGGVKFGLTSTGTKGIVKTVDEGSFGHHKYVTFFYDSSGFFQSYMVNLYLDIVGKGSYLISKVSGDTLTLKTNPPVGTYAYSVLGLTGLPVDTFQNKQTAPSITSDGTGGCYLAWTSNATTPNGIYVTRIDTTGTALWDPAPGPGFLIYQSQNVANPSKNVWINRDSNELLLAWEVTNSENSSQEVYAQRMRNSSLYDTATEWGSAVDVSSNQIDDQTAPRIYGDDSVVLGARGALVPFLDAEPGASDDVDLAMVRVRGDGGTLLPPAGNGFWFFDQKPHAQSGMRTVKIADPTDAGTHTGILAVWNDAWDGTDTMVYAQRLDRAGRRYFPTMGTSSRWGLAISGDSGTHPWTAKQVALIPRGNNGGIAVWTDFRNGNSNPDIYAQLILGDGVASIPTDLVPPVSTVISRAGSYDGSICNARCIDALAIDTGSVASGVSSIVAATMTNMKLTVPAFTPGKDSISYNVCVTDSMLDGSASVAVTDVAGNEKMENFTYCTIPDTLPPIVTWDSLTGWLHFHFTDNRPWDRGLDSIRITDTNVNFSPALTTLKSGSKSFDVVVTQTNASLSSSFTIQAVDTDGNSSAIYSFAKTVADAVLASPMNAPVSLSIFPNPASGASLVTIQGAHAGEVSVYDVLGREVDHFHLEGSYEWNPGTLAPGTYYVRANIGGVIVSKSIVRE